MAGCGGCGPEGCNGPCSTRQPAPRTPGALTEALAKVIIDNRVVRKTIELHKKHPNYSAEDIIVMVNLAKENGELV